MSHVNEWVKQMTERRWVIDEESTARPEGGLKDGQHRVQTDLPEGWVTLDEFVNNNPLIKDFMLDVERILVMHETRRTVQVSTRKYRSRKKRRA